MGPQQSSSPLLPPLFQSRFTTEVRSLRWGMAQRQTRFRCCSENLTSPKTLRVGVAFMEGCS